MDNLAKMGYFHLGTSWLASIGIWYTVPNLKKIQNFWNDNLFLKLYKIIPTQHNSPGVMGMGVMTTKKSMCFLEQGKWNTLYKFTFKQNLNPLGLRWNKFPKNNLTHKWTRHLKQDRTYWPIPAKISGI